jgi:cell division protease FtsH
MGSEPVYSDEIAREIDDEIRRIVENAHQTARDILDDHRDDLERISEILLVRETIDAEQFVELLEGKSEEEVFPAKEEPAAEQPDYPTEPEPIHHPSTEPSPGPPRPGYAGGMTDIRSDSDPLA